MRRQIAFRFAIPFLLLALAASPGYARGRGAAGRPGAASGSASSWMLWLRAGCAALPLRGLCEGLVEKIGCRADPSGACLPEAATTPPASEIGCTVDPSGQCRKAGVGAITASEIGCRADPDGRCRVEPGSSVTQGDIGCSADPSGRCLGQ